MRLIIFGLMIMASTAFGRDLSMIKEKSIEGADYKFNELKNKVVIVVNIASQCGYTPQLAKLEKLHRKYKNKNVVVLGVPTNDFGGQTPQDDKGMKEFCMKNYDVTFPLLNKQTVKGAEKRDLYKFLTEESAKEFNGNIDWNFEKFLINKKGEVVARFGSNIDPLDKEITNKIDALLK